MYVLREVQRQLTYSMKQFCQHNQCCTFALKSHFVSLTRLFFRSIMSFLDEVDQADKEEVVSQIMQVSKSQVGYHLFPM